MVIRLYGPFQYDKTVDNITGLQCTASGAVISPVLVDSTVDDSISSSPGNTTLAWQKATFNNEDEIATMTNAAAANFAISSEGRNSNCRMEGGRGVA